MLLVGFLLFGIFSARVTNASAFHNIQKRASNYEFTTSELAQNWGYDSEEHEITTEDGYIVTTFRIKRKGEQEPLGRKPLLLLSGFATSSDHYLVAMEKPLALHVLDADYDIWLGNVRGSRYGKKHKYKSATNVDFWDFSWHEIAVYDVPAMIDYILDKTNNTKLGYVGYSAGTTIFYAMMSKKPEYNDKVAIGLMVAPVVYWYHNQYVALDVFAIFGSSLFEFALEEKLINLLASEGPLIETIQRICTDAQLFPYVCQPLLTILAGVTDSRQSDDNMRRFLEYTSSTGFKQLVHYAQVYGSGKFREYKYPTPSANLLKYGSVEPPEYNIKSARVPMIIIAAHNDRLAVFEDVDILAKAAPNLLLYDKFPYLYYGHFSMAAAKNSSTYLSHKILPILQKISFS